MQVGFNRQSSLVGRKEKVSTFLRSLCRTTQPHLSSRPLHSASAYRKKIDLTIEGDGRAAKRNQGMQVALRRRLLPCQLFVLAKHRMIRVGTQVPYSFQRMLCTVNGSLSWRISPKREHLPRDAAPAHGRRPDHFLAWPRP